MITKRSFLKLIPLLPISAIRAKKKDDFVRKVIYKAPMQIFLPNGNCNGHGIMVKLHNQYLLECNHEITIPVVEKEITSIVCEKCKAFNLNKNK